MDSALAFDFNNYWTRLWLHNFYLDQNDLRRVVG